MTPLLQLRRLSVHFDTAAGPVPAVQEVDLAVGPGDCLGIVGESGAGKTQLLLAAFGLAEPAARVAGEAGFDAIDLLRADARVLASIRGARVGFVFQDPMTALTPHLTVGKHIEEVLRVHRGMDRTAGSRRALELLASVRIGDPVQRLQQYPHELSGGMRQRVMLALALACDPELLIADEPTTALDVTVQAGVLELLRELKTQRRLAIVLVTHDFGAAAMLCDRIAVMYAGRIVEQGRTEELFGGAQHPYTRALLQSLPRLDTPADLPLASIRGRPPGPYEPRAACAYASRCERADAACAQVRPELARPVESSAHGVACHHPYAPQRSTGSSGP